MKIVLTIFMLLALPACLKAQSGANSETNSGKQESPAVKNTQKANNSQIEGKGIPYNKETKSQQRAGAKRTNHPIPPSSVGTIPDAAASPNAKLMPRSHTAQREMNMRRKASPNTSNSSKENQ